MANLQIQKFVQLMQIRIIKIFITLNYFMVKFYLYKDFSMYFSPNPETFVLYISIDCYLILYTIQNQI